MNALPMEVQEATTKDVDRIVGDMDAELLACFGDVPWAPPTSSLPPLTQKAEAALDRIASSLKKELQGLSPQEILAVCAATMDMVEQLEEDASAPAPVHDGQPPKALDPNSKILSAAQKNDIDAVLLHLADGISPSHANSLGQTPLHIACMWGNADVAKVLIEAGAFVGAANQLSAATPLHALAQSTKDVGGRIACAQLLLAAGADASKKDADGFAPWQKIAANGDATLREVLRPKA
ncbi:ankyrin repeat-containing domain protein [Pelagophyceae sp. CCMP2097]|nr:ankyrin repeat-containing domain protein [Pelagophyceae sp. CCMP2097]